MGFFNTFFRTVKCSTNHSLIKNVHKYLIFEKTCQQFQSVRPLTLSQQRSTHKPAPTETLDLDAWKKILKSRIPDVTSEEEVEKTEEFSIEGMQKLVDMWRLAGKDVPDSISTNELQELLELSTKSSKKKYLKALYVKEAHKKLRESKKLEKQSLRNETEKSIVMANTYLLKFWDKSEDCFNAWRSAQSMVFGQPLVFDMAYDYYMSKKDMENTVSQLMLCEAFNRKAEDPFHIHFCNLQTGGRYHIELVKRYQGAWENILITSTAKSHIDIFPKDQLVYLTSDSPNVLNSFDHDKVYIVGGFVDKCQKTGVSLGYAKQHKITTARLPLERYLKWESGAKNLTLNQMIEILMTLKDTGDWQNALSFVPQRKHLGFLVGSRFPEKPVSKNTKTPESGKIITVGNQKVENNRSNTQKQIKWWQDEQLV